MKRKGGFKTRHRIILLRVLWSYIRYLPVAVTYDLPRVIDNSYDFVWRMDRADLCPHLEEWWDSESIVAEQGESVWINCNECGRCIYNPNGWLIDR